MYDIDRIKAFLSATNLHVVEGELFGMSRGDVAKLLLAYGVGLHLNAHGRAETVNALRKQANTLDVDD